MSAQPPPGADLRLWQQAYDLAEQHSDRNGRCAACGTSAPCRIAAAAAEAMRRAVPAVDPASSAATGEMPTQVIAERPNLAPPTEATHRWAGDAEPETEEVWEQAIPEPGESWQPPRLVRRPSKAANPAPDPAPAPSWHAPWQQQGQHQQGQHPRQAPQSPPQPTPPQPPQPQGAWGAPVPQAYSPEQPYPGTPQDPAQQAPQRYPGQQMQHEHGRQWQQGGPWQNVPQNGPTWPPQPSQPPQDAGPWQPAAQEPSPWQAPPSQQQPPHDQWAPASQTQSGAAAPSGPAVPPQGGPWRHGHPSGPQQYVTAPGYPPQQEQGGWEQSPEPSAETGDADGVWEQLIPEPGDPWLPPRPSAVRQGGLGARFARQYDGDGEPDAAQPPRQPGSDSPHPGVRFPGDGKTGRRRRQ